MGQLEQGHRMIVYPQEDKQLIIILTASLLKGLSVIVCFVFPFSVINSD